MRWVRGRHIGRDRKMRTSRSLLPLLQTHLVYYLLCFFFLFLLLLLFGWFWFVFFFVLFCFETYKPQAPDLPL